MPSSQIPTLVVRIRRQSSYTPKKMNPPMPIHITRGPTPDMSVAGPSSAQMRWKVSAMPVYARPRASWVGGWKREGEEGR